ncbi:MAG: prepilin peptidase [Candidatus Margulisbacteria bacterium]|jgi:prepilin signal peptidase PulO-like enzyme (type II secretory pathway)|nr:prepilin peptidase [Candidatus Margulisiibacteriota bacterium]
MPVLAAVILSAAAGSFCNMLIYRLNNGVPLLRPAHSICPLCRERLHWFELIPVFSFLFLRGRCGSCGEKIPARYLFVELAFILTAVIIVWRLPAPAWPHLVLSWFVWAVFFSDWEYQEIPYFFSLGFALILFYFGLRGSPANLLIWLGLFLFIKALERFHYRRPVFGGADFLFFFLLALYFPLVKYLLCLYLAFFSGLIVSLVLLAARRAGRDSLIAFTPFILLAFVIVQYGGGGLAYVL